MTLADKISKGLIAVGIGGMIGGLGVGVYVMGTTNDASLSRTIVRKYEIERTINETDNNTKLLYETAGFQAESNVLLNEYKTLVSAGVLEEQTALEYATSKENKYCLLSVISIGIGLLSMVGPFMAGRVIKETLEQSITRNETPPKREVPVFVPSTGWIVPSQLAKATKKETESPANWDYKKGICARFANLELDDEEEQKNKGLTEAQQKALEDIATRFKNLELD